MLKKFGPLVRIRDERLVAEGSAERLRLKRIAHTDLNASAAARAVARSHLPMKAADAVMTELFDTGEAYVEVPKLGNFNQFESELRALGIDARRHGTQTISMRSVREALSRSQVQFALRFGLEEATVRNWEQGKSRPNATALALLWTIHRNPDAVVASIGTDETGDREAAGQS